MIELVLATRNCGKLLEYRQLMDGLPVQLYSLANYPSIPEIVENGTTFRANALLKAKAVTAMTGLLALADDSGLEVDYLNGEPGVLSARYAGVEYADDANNQKLLKELHGIPAEQRTARFRCVIAITTPQRQEFFSEGVCEGMITDCPRGEAGFGYDPLFLVPSLGKTFAELGATTKNQISHRARAIQAAREVLAKLLTEQ